MENSLERARKNFLDLELGMFIHFGLYSLGKEHEWHIWNHRMPIVKYMDAFMPKFNPDPAGIEQWVQIAKEMGAGYMVVTSKHGDGFCLWDTAHPHPGHPDYHIRNTPFYEENGCSVLDVLFDAGRKHGVKIGLYHCLIDWSWSTRRFSSVPDHRIKNKKLLAAYIKNLNARIKELVEIYPDVYLFWFDAHVFYRNGFEKLGLRNTYEMLHRLKPDVLVGFNSATTRQVRPPPVSDFLIFENMAHLGEANPSPMEPGEYRGLPGEVCLTINNHWGYNEKDKDYKDPAFILELILENKKRHCNTLLNFGPKPDGYIADDQVSLALELGRLLRKHRAGERMKH